MGYLTISGVTLARLFPSWPAAVTDINVGFVALVVNVLVLVVVSLATSSRLTARVDPANWRPAAANPGSQGKKEVLSADST